MFISVHLRFHPRNSERRKRRGILVVRISYIVSRKGKERVGYSRGKVQAGILSMKFFGRFVVCLRGGAFVGEVAEVVGFVVGAYGRGPFFVGFVPVDAFVL